MANIVKTIFTVDASQAFKTADEVEARYARTDAKAKSAGALLPSSATANLDQAFGKVNILTEAIKSNSLLAGSVAAKATAQAQALGDKLRQIRIETTRTTDPVALKGLEAKLKSTSEEADRLAVKLDRVSRGREDGKMRIGPGRFGGALNAASAAGVPYATEVSGLLEAAAAMGPVATGIVATIGAGVAFIGAAKLASEAYLKEANNRLKSETKISIEYGRQRSALYEIVTATYDLANARKAAQENREFQRGVSRNDVEGLRTQRAQLERELESTRRYAGLSQSLKGSADPMELEKIQTLEKRLLELDSVLDGRNQNRLALQNEAFNNRNEQFKRSQQQAAEQELKRLDNVREGISKVRELTKAYSEAFTSVLVDTNRNNPFVSMFFDANRQLEEFRENTRGLNKDLVELGVNKLRADSSLKLFEQRINTSVESQDLREIALKFRDRLPQDRPGESDQDYEKRINALYGRSGKANDGTSTIQRIELIQQRMIRSIANSSGLSETGRLSAARGAIELTRREGESNEGTQSRLNRQLSAIDKIRPENTEERNAADRKILSIASNLDPEKLTNVQRNRVAEIAERQAAVVESREIEAIKIARENIEIQKEIRENQKRLLEIAQKGGINAIKTEITVKDETASGVKSETRPAAATQKDVNRTYMDEFTGR